MLQVIPKLVINNECNDYREELIKIIEVFGDPTFIVNLVNICNVYFYAAKMEKSA